MAFIEFNALSVHLGGSFSAKFFAPEMDKLKLNDGEHVKRYPVLWLIHSDGGTAMDWCSTPIEAAAVKHGIFVVAVDVQHSLCTDMAYGPAFETFLKEELPGICRKVVPISSDPAFNWIGGVGTGAYGAMKLAIQHPDVFSRAFALDGWLDLQKVGQKLKAGVPTGIPHTLASYEAVFGDADSFMGSKHDIFTLASGVTSGEFYIACSETSQRLDEYTVFASLLKDRVTFVKTPQAYDDKACYFTLPPAVEWACR